MSPLRLAQSQLNLLETCPRKFQHLVLEQLGPPEAIEQQERLLQGAKFHLLIQQWLMELPIEPMLQEDHQLQQWVESFQVSAPKILSPGEQQAESDRILEFAGYLLTVRYDLLILSEHAARILDWKTYARPRQQHWLEQHWQTRLYPFVLAETSTYLPEQISLVYWFFQHDQTDASPQSLTFTYNRSKHEQTRQDLSSLLAQLSQWLAHYQAGAALPQVRWGSPQCETCNFAGRCERAIAPLSNTQNKDGMDDLIPPHLPSLAEIAEIPL